MNAMTQDIKVMTQGAFTAAHLELIPRLYSFSAYFAGFITPATEHVKVKRHKQHFPNDTPPAGAGGIFGYTQA